MSSEPLSLERLDEIEGRAKAATDGPWGPAVHGRLKSGDGVAMGMVVTVPPEHKKNLEADRDFAAHARTDIPDLLAEVRRLLAVQAQAIHHLERGDADKHAVREALRVLRGQQT